MTPEQRERRNAARRVKGPRKKPGPKPKASPLQEGRDFYCGGCAGHRVIPCEYCMDGCRACLGVGQVACPACNGGAVPSPPPDYLSQG